MKKFLSTAMIIAMLAATVTGCSNKNHDDSSSVNDSSSVTESNSDVSSDTESSDTEAAALTAEQMAANILATGEWPMLMPITDAETANSVLGIDLTLAEDYAISIPSMSAHVTEVIIIKPKAGNESAIQEQVDARFAYVQENGAFYPDNEKVVAGAVKGVTDSGYIYMIVHENGAAAEEAMLNNPPAEAPGAGAEDGAENGGAEAFLTASDMAANILAATEWPSLMPVADSDTASMMGFDLSLVDDFYIAMPMMSAHVTEIVIMLPLEGNEAAVQEQVDARFAYVQENGAFYPTNEEVVAGAVKGVTDDGYIYMIVHTDGALCEENMQNNPPAEMPAM